jgi:hypothetical protein
MVCESGEADADADADVDAVWDGWAEVDPRPEESDDDEDGAVIPFAARDGEGEVRTIRLILRSGRRRC